MKHAFIMDPLEGVKPWKDTSYFLMRACAERGHEVCHLDQKDLYAKHDRLYGHLTWLEVLEDGDFPFSAIRSESASMMDIDVVWIRTDPPLDRRYFYTTLLLDLLPETTRVVNRPSGIRNFNEKLAALKFPDLTPKTLVTSDVDEIVRFAEQRGRITVKPVDGFGGKGILFFNAGDPPERLAGAVRNNRHWVIAQEYLTAAADGDKRILLLDGEPLGAILRVHADGQELNNMDAGGTPNPSTLSARDLEICRALGPALRDQGLYFAGIDIIGGMLIEINVTSPTGLQEMARFDGVDYHHRIIEELETCAS